MAILSTNTKLVRVGQEYSAGSGISIDNYVISVTGDVGGKTYSAGDNIGIYTQDNQLYISGKDWEQDIANASANAYNASTAQIPTPFDPTFISAQIDNKLNSSDFTNWQNGQYSTDLQTIEGQINNKLDSSSFSDVSGNFLTAINIPESATWNDTSDVVKESSASWNQGKTYEGISPIVVNNDENKVSADTWTFSAGSNVSFVDDNVNKITRIDVELPQPQDLSYISAQVDSANAGVDYLSGVVITALPSDLATTGDVAELAQTISETYQTKGDYLVRSDSANFYPMDGNPSGFLTAHQSLSNYYTKDETSGKEELASAFANIPVGDPEVNAYVTSNSASIDESTNLVQSNSSTWNDVTAYQSNSANYITAHQSLEGLMSASLLESADGKWTAYNNIPFKAGDEFPASADEAITTYQTNSGLYLTAHQDISNKLDTTAFSDVSGDFLTTSFGISESATWNDVSETVQTNSSVWNDKLDASSLDLEIGNSWVADPSITGAYQISGAYIVAKNAYADSQGRVITGWYQLKDDNLLSGTKYGTLKIDNENTHLVDTTFSALSSYNGIIASAIPASGVGFYTYGGYNDHSQSTTSHSYDNVKSYSIKISTWDTGFTAQINGTNYNNSYFNGNGQTITGEFNTPSTLVVNLYRSNTYADPTVTQFNLGVAGEVNEVVDIRDVFTTNEQLNTASSYLSGAIDYVSSNAGGSDLVHKSDFTFVTDQWGTYLQKVSGKYIDYATRAGQAELDKNGHEITAHYFTTANANTLSSMLSGAIDYVSANAGGGGNPEVESYVQTNSANIDETVGCVQTNSASWGVGGSGITGVSHDNTLSGDGTNASPLGIVNGYNETVLFETTAVYGAGVCNLSESLKNFERIAVKPTRGYTGTPNPGGAGPWNYFDTDQIVGGTTEPFQAVCPYIMEYVNWKISQFNPNSDCTVLTWSRGFQKNMETNGYTTASDFTGCVGIQKVIGINRK